MKKVCTYICLLTVLWLLAAGTVLEQQRLAARVIRLHILANSDSAEDQTEKLRVRDALLGEIEALTADCTSREAAAAKLAGAAEELGTTAVAAGLSGGEVRLMTEDSPDIRVRFFLLELLSSLREKLRG